MNKIEADNLKTYFAPAARENSETIEIQSKLFFANSDMKSYLDAIPDMYFILNDKRQIVFANSAVIQNFENEYQSGSIFGTRPGELLNCSNAKSAPNGCGTHTFCRTCGAVNAILSGLKGINDIQECRIIQDGSNDALDLRVWTTHLEKNGKPYTIFAVHDISDEKRRRALERIFFHDVLNTAGGLKGFTQYLAQNPEDVNDVKDTIYQITVNLIDEMMHQKDLVSAENNELKTDFKKASSGKLVKSLLDLYSNHEISKGKRIEIDPESEDSEFMTDFNLLRRVVGNMLKNAIEATPEGESVKIKSRSKDKFVMFSIKNPGYIPKDIQGQIFQRSFSTKGKDRGLGTYSIKLLTERYLHGKVHFTTSKTDGTTFYAIYPKNHI